MAGFEDTAQGNANAARIWQRDAAIHHRAIAAMVAQGRLSDAVIWQREAAWSAKIARDYMARAAALAVQS